jgi:biopolymer transport protein ExbD
MSRKSRYEEVHQELDLIPIMNTVMILIPMLVLMVSFAEPGVINISSPRQAQNTTPDPEQRPEEQQVPKVVVYISSDGFRVGNTNPLTPVEEFQQYANPIEGCAGGAAPGTGGVVAPHDLATVPATVCVREGVPATAALVDRLDYAGLYNQLVRVRMHPAWFDAFGEENNSVISILADPEVPYEVVVKTMDTARFFLATAGEGTAPPTAASNVSTYLLGGGQGRPTSEQLESTRYIDGPAEGMDFIDLFPDPVLLLPRPGAAG